MAQHCLTNVPQTGGGRGQWSKYRLSCEAMSVCRAVFVCDIVTLVSQHVLRRKPCDWTEQPSSLVGPLKGCSQALRPKISVSGDAAQDPEEP